MELRGLTLDPFQEQAINLLRDGHSVLVSAPTGTGKTIIADSVVDQVLAEGRTVIYTAPVKALSNQKFRDYRRMHGEERVGLVTGDLVINREAPCLVMTTEILRNMLLDAGQDGQTGAPPNLAAVILDEIHFLDDRERGTVWEEVLIYLPPEVKVLGLSATLSNLQEFADWLSEVRGRTVHVIEERERAVPLELLIGEREHGLMSPKEFEKGFQRWKRMGGDVRGPRRRRRDEGGEEGGGDRRRGRPDDDETRHGDLFRMLMPDLAPYLYFVHSRRLAEEYARSLGRRLNRSLLPFDDRPALHARIDEAIETLGRDVVDGELEGLYRKGVAFHHAGLHVQLKALVEELYERKLIMVLYTTSTFALGVNMPARSVAMDSIVKFDGRSTNPLTVREFLQQAGRAGRRGMDAQGYVVIKADFKDFGQIAPWLQRYISGEPERVNSSFNLSFNSVVSLLERHPRAKVRALVERSFLSYKMRAQAKGLEGQAERVREQLRAAGDDPSQPPAEGLRPAQRKQRKELRRLEHRVEEAAHKAFMDFEARRMMLVEVGYLSENDELLAGAKVLRNLRIEEIFSTELVLSGVIEDMSPEQLFGILCAMTNSLPKGIQLRTNLQGELRSLAKRVNDVRYSPPVLKAEAITGLTTTWDPDVILFGHAWASGRSLKELQLLYWSQTDIAGQLVSGFRRAKDLVGQLRDVYHELPDRAAAFKALITRVSRDEVEVID
ncbi:MAG: DEAD/DEAH box helicase [Deltaproteobacteria bacterium]|nr:DEAD/DEAH box helicase [Deltaproteobacteria bacterium]